MLHLEFKELFLLGSLHKISRFTLLIPRLESFNTALDLNDLVFLSAFLVFLLNDLLFQVVLSVLSKKLLSHGESHSTLIQGLVGRVSLLDIIANTEE